MAVSRVFRRLVPRARRPRDGGGERDAPLRRHAAARLQRDAPGAGADVQRDPKQPPDAQRERVASAGEPVQPPRRDAVQHREFLAERAARLASLLRARRRRGTRARAAVFRQLDALLRGDRARFLELRAEPRVLRLDDAAASRHGDDVVVRLAEFSLRVVDEPPSLRQRREQTPSGGQQTISRRRGVAARVDPLAQVRLVRVGSRARLRGDLPRVRKARLRPLKRGGGDDERLRDGSLREQPVRREVVLRRELALLLEHLPGALQRGDVRGVVRRREPQKGRLRAFDVQLESVDVLGVRRERVGQVLVHRLERCSDGSRSLKGGRASRDGRRETRPTRAGGREGPKKNSFLRNGARLKERTFNHRRGEAHELQPLVHVRRRRRVGQRLHREALPPQVARLHERHLARVKKRLQLHHAADVRDGRAVGGQAQRPLERLGVVQRLGAAQRVPLRPARGERAESGVAVLAPERGRGVEPGPGEPVAVSRLEPASGRAAGDARVSVGRERRRRRASERRQRRAERGREPPAEGGGAPRVRPGRLRGEPVLSRFQLFDHLERFVAGGEPAGGRRGPRGAGDGRRLERLVRRRERHDASNGHRVTVMDAGHRHEHVAGRVRERFVPSIRRRSLGRLRRIRGGVILVDGGRRRRPRGAVRGGVAVARRRGRRVSVLAELVLQEQPHRVVPGEGESGVLAVGGRTRERARRGRRRRRRRLRLVPGVVPRRRERRLAGGFKSTPSAFAFEPAALSFTAAPPKERSVSVGVDAAKSPNPDALVFVASLGLPGSPVLSCPPYTNSNVSLPITFAPFASRSTVIVCAPPGDIPCGIANGARDLRRSAGCANPATPFTPSVIRRFRSNACAAIDFLRAFSAWVISTVIVTPLTPPPGVSRAAPHTPCAPASSAEVKLKSESAVAVGVGPPAPGGGKFTVGVAPPFETAF
eukprot:31540-Pelagococcus_subviridis.AAC.2